MDFRIYYEDTDCSGIVYHSNYLKFCERARSELFFQKMLLPQNKEGFFVVAGLEAKFLGSARLGDLIRVISEVIDTRRTFLFLKQKIFLIQDGIQHDKAKELFDMNVRLAFLDSVTRKPKKIPQSLLEVISECRG